MVAAARRAFGSWSQTSVADRIAVINNLVAAYSARMDDLSVATEEMGAPTFVASNVHAAGLAHLATAATAWRPVFAEDRGPRAS